MGDCLMALFLFLLFAACAPPITQEAKEDLQAPINCATAQDDIALLQSEKANVNQTPVYFRIV